MDGTVLRKPVAQSRRLLEDGIGDVLEGHFGIHPDGRIEDERQVTHLADEDLRFRQLLVAHLQHIQDSMLGGGAIGRVAVEQLVREIGFTHLNRLCAFKILERRRLIREAVGRGLNSNGFKFYLAQHPEDEERALAGQQDAAYRHFLAWLGATLADEIGFLFGPHDPASRVLPSHRVLEQVLALINSAELQDAWDEDEAIGWIYQYYTPKEMRDRARKESHAPRNSYELAFRNQFYTPRYVVEFLVDNTLGRLWYEMRQGNTRLAQLCTKMVLRRHVVFLSHGQGEPAPFEPGTLLGDPDLPGEMWVRPNPGLENLWDIWRYALTVGGYDYARRHLGRECGELANERLERFHQTGHWEGSFEELRCCLFFEQRRWRNFEEEPDAESLAAIRKLYQAICERWDIEVEYVPYRPKKDPRDIRVLDPACGSGHFLLYCFDLLTVMYDEAWADAEAPPSAATGQTLRADYPNREALLRAVPGLILRHNLHGIDIDLRSVQIAGLALWLRAQRAFHSAGVAARDRPKVTRANLACAEPMPGEADLLAEFTADLEPAVLGQLAQRVFHRMRLAGEAGSLLRIEEDIREDVAEMKRVWKAGPKPAQLMLWPEARRPKPEQLSLFDVVGISDEAFWDEAEARLLEALAAYAERTTNGRSFSRRLFAEDAEQGFAFIDMCRKHFDVVLMNPPFGEPSRPSKDYVEKAYPRTKNDVFAAFVERGLGWLVPRGYLGAITSHTGFFLSSFQKWREEILLHEARLVTLADLGYGVLDTAMVETAMVETAAYCLENRPVSAGSNARQLSTSLF